MLTNLTVKNLGCFDEYPYSANFNKLTVLVGINNSGKSMMLSGLNLIRVFSHRNLEWNNGYYHLQNNTQAVYSHDTKRIIELNAKYSLGADSYECRLSIQNDKFTIDQFLKNGHDLGSLTKSESQDLAKTVWYLHPERRHIPFTTEIGTSLIGIQPLYPTGLNVVDYLFGKFNDRDKRYDDVEKWLKEIDPSITLLKTPLDSKSTSMVTARNDKKTVTEVNMSLQGSGINSATAIITGIIFSPPHSTIIIEEPENFLNLRSIEKLVDLFNYAVNSLSKQIIITTHSWYILGEYAQDICKNATMRSPKRIKEHIPITPSDFRLLEFTDEREAKKITDYNLIGKDYGDVIDNFSHL